MIYKSALALSILLAVNVTAMEVECCHPCPKGKRTCRCSCHHEKNHEPTFEQPPPKTIAPSNRAQVVDTISTQGLANSSPVSPSIAKSDVSLDVPINLPVNSSVVDTISTQALANSSPDSPSIAKSDVRLDVPINLPVNSSSNGGKTINTNIANTVMSTPIEPSLATSTNIFSVESNTVQAAVQKKHHENNTATPTNFLPVTKLDNASRPVLEIEVLKIKKEHITTTLEVLLIQEHPHFFKGKHKRKIPGGGEIKGDPKELKDNGLPPPEIQEDIRQDEYPITSWLEYLLGWKTIKHAWYAI